MVRLLFRLAPLLTALLLLPVALIRSQTYDDSELRTVFAPSASCPSSCFLGIQPGVTTAEEAIAILTGHAWVQDVDAATAFLDNGMIVFRWNDATPSILDQRTYAVLNVWDRVIRYAVVPTTVPTGYLLMLEGRPTDMTLIENYNRQAVSARYLEHSLMVYAQLTCPLTHDAFWHTPATMIFRADLDEIDSVVFQPHSC